MIPRHMAFTCFSLRVRGRPPSFRILKRLSDRLGAWSFIVCAGLAVCGPSCARPPLKGNMTECSALLRFGGPSSGTSVRRRSCGQRRVTRSWWNWLCDRYFAAILRSTARRLQLENARDSTLSKRSLCTLTRSSSIVRSRVPLPIGRHPRPRPGCI